VASSRLIWAVARDGVLPFSGWISQVSDKKEPKNAVTVMLGTAALLLCTILPSPVAFSSLVSAAGVPTITAYALICCKFLRKRVTATQDTNGSSRTYLHHPWEIQASEMVSRPLLPTFDLHCLRVELVSCLCFVLSTVLPSHCRHVKLFPGHFRRHYHLRYSLLVVYSGGSMAAQCSLG